MELENIIGAKAFIGREKSTVLVRSNSKESVTGLREVMFHELVHIFCGKIEMDGEHFIDIYGCGHTPDENPVNLMYDGQLNAGYVVWSEFIAQYYALRLVHQKSISSARLSGELFALLGEVHVNDINGSKRAFAMVCSYMLSCADADRLIMRLSEPGYIFDDSEPFGAQTREAFTNCLPKLHKNLKKDKPWKINQNFIEELGAKYLMFISMNSIYLGHVNPELLGDLLNDK